MRGRKWIRHQGQHVTFGEPDVSQLGSESVITITRSENLSVFRLLIAAFLNEGIMRQMRKRDAVLFSEVAANVRDGWAQTMSVWKNGQDMTSFRDSGMHRWVLQFFRWVFYGGRVQSYVLTYKAWGEIPNLGNAAQLVKEHGRYSDGGKVIRTANVPKGKGNPNNECAGA